MPSDYPTIQAAIDASRPGDEVLVAPGTYTARSTKTLIGPPITGVPSTVTALAFIPIGVALRSEAGAAQTILDGVDGTVRGVIIHGGKTRDVAGRAEQPATDLGNPPATSPATLQGFTLLNMTNAITVGNVRFAIHDNIVSAKIEIWEATTTGLIRGNTQTASTVFCYTTSADGIAWQDNVFEASGGNIICRCNRSSWSGNTFRKGLSLWPYVSSATVAVVDNQFIGGGVDGLLATFQISGNAMDGLGSGTGLLIAAPASGVIEDNVISRYGSGLTIANLEVRNNAISRCGAGFVGVGDGAFIHHNQIFDHTFWGIRTYTTLAIFEDNTILRCGSHGVWIEVGYPTLRRNHVLSGAAHGMVVERGFLEDNIVAFNAGDGIRVQSGSSAALMLPTVVTGCTIVGNGINGIVCGYTAGAGSRITNNIIAHNSQYGVDFLSYDLPDLVGCNDVYSNSAGTFSGYGAGLDSLNGNIVLNPLFCGPVLPLIVPTDFRLQEGSPCIPDNSGDCGLIGAVSEFCPTAPGKAEEPPSSRRSWGWLKGHYR